MTGEHSDKAPVASNHQAEMAVHSAIIRALDEAGVKPEVLRGMCIEVGLEKFREVMTAVETTPRNNAFAANMEHLTQAVAALQKRAADCLAAHPTSGNMRYALEEIAGVTTGCPICGRSDGTHGSACPRGEAGTSGSVTVRPGVMERLKDLEQPSTPTKFALDESGSDTECKHCRRTWDMHTVGGWCPQ